MSEPNFKVVFSGHLLDGFDSSVVRQQFSDKFKAPDQLVDRVFGGGPVVIKKDLEQTTAIRLAELLNKLGMQAECREMPPVICIDHLSLELAVDKERPTADPAGTEPVVPSTSSPDACPKCGSTQLTADECQSCGIIISKFNAIQSESQTESDAGDATDEQQRREERLDALSAPSSNKQAFQTAWKIMVPVFLVLFLGWRWYQKMVPDAFSEVQVREIYVEACDDSETCMVYLDDQWDTCFQQADYERYRDAAASSLLAEEEEFIARLDQCMVDDDGDPIFY